MPPPHFSVIVPARNGAATLSACLAALRTGLAIGDELIVVDDASADETPQIARQHDATVVSLAERAGPAAARNRGAAIARGEVLLFVDADVTVHADALRRLRDCLSAEDAPDAVFGSYDAAPPALATVSRFRNLLHHFTHQHGARDASTFWAGLGAIRRSTFEQVGGFDACRYPYPSIEDIELGYRLRRAGGRIHLDPEVQGTHLKRWSLATMLRTDLLSRAIPWSRLILETRFAPDDLNVRRSQRASVALALASGGALAAAPLVPELAVAAATGVLALTGLNRKLYGFLWRQGPFFAVLCVPLHALHLGCAGLGYLYALVERWAPARPTPASSLLSGNGSCSQRQR